MDGRRAPSDERFVDPTTGAALVVLVGATYGPAGLAVRGSARAGVLAFGALYLIVTLVSARILEATPRSRSTVLAVFSAQLLVIALSATYAGGRTVLSALATVSLAVLYLSVGGRALVIGAVVAVMAHSMFTFAESLTVAVQALAGLASAVLFVAAFSHLARSRHEARAALARAHRTLQDQSSRLAELAREKERLRIARDIHDSVGHWLTSAHVHVEAARATLDSDRDACRTALDGVAAATRSGLADVRRSVAALRDPVQPLEASLAALVDDAQRSGLAAEFEATTVDDAPAPDEITRALLRIVQEALTNVRKHADARRVAVRLERNAGEIALTVEDDGLGLDPDRAFQGPRPDGSGLGLESMRARVAALGGHLTVDARAGTGTRLRVEVPR